MRLDKKTRKALLKELALRYKGMKTQGRTKVAASPYWAESHDHSTKNNNARNWIKIMVDILRIST